MSRTDQYQRILDELAGGELDELQDHIYHFLHRAYPSALTRQELRECIYGHSKENSKNTNNNTYDRKIRRAISSMIELGVPIVSTSGDAGYRISIDMESWNEVLEELSSKKRSFERKIEAAERIVEKIKEYGRAAIPTSVPVQPRQLSFVDGAR